MAKTKLTKQHMHQNSVMRKNLKNRRRRNALEKIWHRNGGQLKTINQSLWTNDDKVNKFLNISNKPADKATNETITIDNNVSSEEGTDISRSSESNETDIFSSTSENE